MSHFLTRTAQLILMAGAITSISFTHAIAAEPEQAELFAAQEVSDAELSESRGAFLPASLNLNNVELSAQDSHNSVFGGVTGANTIATNGIVNSQGLINVIQNSGNNVVIQSSTIVNLTFNK